MYHKDGVHLNWHGTLKLAENLGIQPNFPTIIVIKLALGVSMGSVASQITDIIDIVNLGVSMGSVASQITDIIYRVNMYINNLPLIQMNQVFTIGIFLIRNPKVITNIVANMSLVEMIIEVITDRNRVQAKQYVDFEVNATTLHQYVDMVLILHVIPVTRQDTSPRCVLIIR